jgi:tetratricopeptide (TPR) repeat protein
MALTPLHTEAQGYDLVARASRLEDAGEYWAAASTLRAYLWSHPGDSYVRWPLARLLYWLGDSDAALAQFDLAASALPNEPWIQVERARILMDFGEWDSAEAALETALGNAGSGSAAETEATALLGTLAYWGGDYSRAVHRFETVLDRQSDRAEVRDQLEAIRSTMRPWFGVSMDAVDDNQPYRRVSGTVTTGRFLTPLWTLAVGGTPRSLDVPGASMAADGWLELMGFVPVLHTDVSAKFGRAWQSSLVGQDAAWIGDLSLSARVGTGWKLRGRGWAERYLWTPSSADTLVMVEGLELALDGAAAPTWAGEVVVRREALPGGNAIRTAYAWGLAPLSPWLRGGYAFSWQDSDDTRWVPVERVDGRDGPGRGRGPPVVVSDPYPGRYAPYFTPEQTTIHALLMELRGKAGSGTVRLNVSYGIRATEQVPSLEVGGGLSSAFQMTFTERHFNPWSVTGAVEFPQGCCTALQAEVERAHTAFYQMTRVSLGFVYRFLRQPMADGG